MIVNNFNIGGVVVLPHKADTPLIVNPDTPVSFKATAQFFKMVTGWHFEKVQVWCCVYLIQQSSCLVM